jgi:hypothetical protein
MTITAWGDATIVEEIQIKQGAGERSFATLVQLLESEKGESLIRFAYSTDGQARRGPVTLRASDLVRLRLALLKAPRLKAALAASLGANDVEAPPKRAQRKRLAS